MPYADSAINYRWAIQTISVDQRRMVVTYDPADSADSSRPTVFQNFDVDPSQFNESDLTAIATSNAASKVVVTEWDKAIEAAAANIAFNEDSYIGWGGSNRYKVELADSLPAYNALRYKLVASDSEGADEIRTSYSLVLMDSDEKRVRYDDIFTSKSAAWALLENNGHEDSLSEILNIDDSVRTWNNKTFEFLSENEFGWRSTIAAVVQDLTGWDDSDLASWMYGNAGFGLPDSV